MSKILLYTRLEKFISKGYLKNIYEGENILIFRFLDTAIVGFVTSKESTERIIGAVLSEGLVEAILRSNNSTALGFLCKRESYAIRFDEELLARCEGKNGIRKVRRFLRKFYDLPNPTKFPAAVPGSYKSICSECGIHTFPKDFTTTVIKTTADLRDSVIRNYKKCYALNIRRMILLGVALVLLLISMTPGIKKMLDYEKVSAPFTQSTANGTYVNFEADLIVRYAEVAHYDLLGNFSELKDYYIFGNTATRQYGFMELSKPYKKSSLIPENAQHVILDEPIKFYGYTCLLSSDFQSLFRKSTEEPEEPEVQDVTGIQFSDLSIDGVNIPLHTIPQTTIPKFDIGKSKSYASTDNSAESIEFMQAHGIAVQDRIFDQCMVSADTDPKMINTVRLFVTNAFSIMAIVTFVGLMISSKALDKINGHIKLNNSVYVKYRILSDLPVIISYSIITVKEDKLREYMKGNKETVFCCSAVLPLSEEAIHAGIFRNGDVGQFEMLEIPAEYMRTGLYFHCSINAGIDLDTDMPALKIKGYINESPDEIQTVAHDSKIKFEVHFKDLAMEELEDDSEEPENEE